MVGNIINGEIGMGADSTVFSTYHLPNQQGNSRRIKLQFLLQVTIYLPQRLAKDSVTILDHYAEVLYALGEYDLAKVYWDMALKKNTENEIPDLAQRAGQKLKAVGK